MSSVWEKVEIEERESLNEDVGADICIIGGGLAGIWLAYLLSKEGRKVVLIEKDRVGRAETAYTTAFITQVIDTDLRDLEKMFDEWGAKLSWQAGAEAIDFIEKAVREESIECDFKRLPIYTYAKDKKELDELKMEADTAQRLGFSAKIVNAIEGFRNVGAMEVPEQAKYHPMKFLRGLSEAAEKHGAKIYEKTEAVEINGRVSTKSGHSIKAGEVVVATYKPFNNPTPVKFKKGMYTSYVYGLELESSMPEIMCEDMANPYHYFRVDDMDGKKIMIVGGEDHREELKFMEDKSFKALREYIDDTFPNLDYKVRYRWSGAILEPVDGLPLIGEYASREYVATAFSGNGMTYSAISAMIITDLIMGRKNKYKDLYDPKRRMGAKPLLYKFRDYAGELFGGAIKNLLK